MKYTIDYIIRVISGDSGPYTELSVNNEYILIEFNDSLGSTKFGHEMDIEEAKALTTALEEIIYSFEERKRK